jgi:Tfp pilus assembly protein PilN
MSNEAALTIAELDAAREAWLETLRAVASAERACRQHYQARGCHAELARLDAKADDANALEDEARAAYDALRAVAGAGVPWRHR